MLCLRRRVLAKQRPQWVREALYLLYAIALNNAQVQNFPISWRDKRRFSVNRPCTWLEFAREELS